MLKSSYRRGGSGRGRLAGGGHSHRCEAGAAAGASGMQRCSRYPGLGQSLIVPPAPDGRS